jgi:hypothetical protein
MMNSGPDSLDLDSAHFQGIACRENRMGFPPDGSVDSRSSIHGMHDPAMADNTHMKPLEAVPVRPAQPGKPLTPPFVYQ